MFAVVESDELAVSFVSRAMSVDPLASRTEESTKLQPLLTVVDVSSAVYTNRYVTFEFISNCICTYCIESLANFINSVQYVTSTHKICDIFRIS